MTRSVSRAWGYAIAAVLVTELLTMPWTGHLFDVSAFFTHTDAVFFAHMPLTENWPFGSISLLIILLSQLPVLLVPPIATVPAIRLTLLKLPSWLADIGTAAIVRWSCPTEENRNLWALRYLLDPAVIFVTVFHGQWDALANLPAVGGIALMLAGRFELAAVAFGLGAGTKFYPAAFVPLLLAVSFKAASPARALRAFGLFAGVSVVTLLPVFWGRLDYVVHAYAFNSFGRGSSSFTVSLWSLLPAGVMPSPRFEQLIAVVIPILLAAAELRHVPEKRDIARTAMFSAMSIVLLNPGAHPPFYLWIAGPLVLYCAVTNDALTSIGGLLLSAAGTLTQFCLEGPDEYFLLSLGAAPREPVLRCVSSAQHLQWFVLGCATWIVIASYRNLVESFWERLGRISGQTLALILAGLFFWQIAAGITSARANPKKASYSVQRDVLLVLALAPAKRWNGRDCLLTYDSHGGAAFAGNPYAAQFVTAELGYSLFTPEELVIRGRPVDVRRLPSRYQGRDIAIFQDGEMRVTREFDVARLLRPFTEPETILERPCSLIRNNPLLVYSMDLDAARATAAAQPMTRRIDFFAQGDPHPMDIDRQRR